MANITVNPTRMELTRLKGKLKTAQRGHKLLKDKRDELMKQFLDTVREVRALRAEVEEDLMQVHKCLYRGLRPHVLRRRWSRRCCIPSRAWSSTCTTQNIMSVNVPVYRFPDRKRSRIPTSTPTASPPPPVSWTTQWRPWAVCSGRC